MPLSRSARITILLVIDIVFFFVELIVGYAVGSLALVADSFHMLNTPEISNPKLVVIVGSLGLASNIVGLFLFHEHTHSHAHSHPPSKITSRRPSSSSVTIADNYPALKSPRSDSRSRSASQSEFSTLYGHPVATRAALVQQAQEMANQSSMNSPITEDLPGAHATEDTPLLNNATGHAHSHGHSHGSMNMRALVLHVIGDALGNVGVISTGLVIWLTQWSFKYYFDPMISLLITIIIFSSALPLVQSASFILLQGVPPTISLDSVRDSILDVEGVMSVHELHVWQLSESKVIASVHVLASRDHDFMPIAESITLENKLSGVGKTLVSFSVRRIKPAIR
ncbi:hypothetical protein C0991_000120 [Blastosporella zonata]|nr:hypothetical protein C0991_000120 [Blastosporella zonata]